MVPSNACLYPRCFWAPLPHNTRSSVVREIKYEGSSHLLPLPARGAEQEHGLGAVLLALRGVPRAPGLRALSHGEMTDHLRHVSAVSGKDDGLCFVLLMVVCSKLNARRTPTA